MVGLNKLFVVTPKIDLFSPNKTQPIGILSLPAILSCRFLIPLGDLTTANRLRLKLSRRCREVVVAQDPRENRTFVLDGLHSAIVGEFLNQRQFERF